MNSRPSLLFLASALLLAPSLFAQGHDHHKAPPAATAANAQVGELLPVTEKDAAWAAKARKEYPLDVCVTSDEKLGSMGEAPEYIYRVDGQPDRLIVFCCAGCEEDFLKEPAKYLAKIDAAKARKPKDANGSSKKDEHKGHH